MHTTILHKYSVPQYKSTLSIFCFFSPTVNAMDVYYIKMIINLY